MITELHDRLETYAKNDDLENRARRYNFRIRGLSETVKDVTSITYSLIQSAVPDIDKIHIERLIAFIETLVPLKPDGPPRDTIVKPYFIQGQGSGYAGNV